MELHWLSAVDRVNFKVATLVYRCLYDLAPPYLSSTLHRVAGVDSRRRLRSSADTDFLLLPRSRRSLVSGCRAANMEQPPSLLSFKRQLKTVFFASLYLSMTFLSHHTVDLAVFFNLGHFKKKIVLHYIHYK